jgi:hypothetical protein
VAPPPHSGIPDPTCRCSQNPVGLSGRHMHGCACLRELEPRLSRLEAPEGVAGSVRRRGGDDEARCRERLSGAG